MTKQSHNLNSLKPVRLLRAAALAMTMVQNFLRNHHLLPIHAFIVLGLMLTTAASVSSFPVPQDSCPDISGFLISQNLPLKPNSPSQEGEDETPLGMGVIAASVGNVRSKPEISSATFYKVTEGDQVSFLKKEDEWYMIKLADDRVGWAHQSLFTAESIGPALQEYLVAQKDRKNEEKVKTT